MSDRSDSVRILAIHAHPDDIEFQCAGTLALLKHNGCSITIASMTPGDCGSAEMDAETIAAVRREEGRRAAELLGAESLCLEFRDLTIIHDNEGRRRVTEVLRKTRPDIVITAPPVDYMSDHEMTSRLVRDACFNAPIPNYTTGADDAATPLEQIPHLYHVDPIEGTDNYGIVIPPDFIIDISTTYALKEEMLACHDSQRAWLRKQHGMDEYLLSCRRWSSRRGEEIGAEFGEGFRQYKGHPYPTDNRLLQLISG